MDFVIDTTGSLASDDVLEPSINNENSLVSKLLEEYRQESATKKKAPRKDDKKNSLMDSFFKEMGWKGRKRKKPQRVNVSAELQNLNSKTEIKEVLKKSVITPEFEKQHIAPPFELSEKVLKKQRKKEAELTKGKKWYGLPATEMTEEVKRDLEILQMRSVLDPKRFYKKNDLKVLPKYFQIGKVMDSPLDYYNNRLTKKERKKTLVDELLADSEFNKYNKRKFKEIIQEKQKTHYKAWREAKKLKKKKK
ncbi:Deoxynucleotidyltransferase terminal-interacting protein 2-like Protein [Tribolium castaneum]|uniref:Deoxynucleotidyltransferase terminal-interacting protein 2-like Protein n=1 Tax=Tribolium castaneum TaxID=7070 RepID=D6WD94_TRICA|nr:PREDICTED: deoxynucleotidyltransferase terminal-interacting protein 2 [Tribolium castaneum]EEZ99490.1 Deoxynucleotidyltransferase terminal-interacting protein 2-like Protein [Tribolium castaneum]|eukprot:XP_969663.2 PREDICTED: deoxynucleotidyltransferase terminal-interacting protein 2 [Tribolium castaneum]